MEVKFSRHVLEKLDDPAIKKLSITNETLRKVLDKPDVIDNSEYPMLTAIGKLTVNLSVCVVYKFAENGIRIITFFPAKRGRYESKILSRR